MKSCFVRSIWILTIALLGLSSATADEVDRERLEQIPLGGLSLDLGAKAAFDKLIAAGYNTDVETYEQWTEPARSFVKGDPSSPRSSPDGWSEFILERNGHRLRAIRLSRINPNNFFDAEEEIRKVRGRLGIAADSPRCKASGPNGFCEATDADGNAGYLLQLLASNQRYEYVELRDLPLAAP